MKTPKKSQKPAKSEKYADRNLAAISPKKQQFEPTPADPVRQHAKMAGAC